MTIIAIRQVFVESLDKRFQNVCELDLIFHSDVVSAGALIGAHVVHTPAGRLSTSSTRS